MIAAAKIAEGMAVRIATDDQVVRVLEVFGGAILSVDPPVDKPTKGRKKK